jgi:hypothetical protein
MLGMSGDVRWCVLSSSKRLALRIASFGSILGTLVVQPGALQAQALPAFTAERTTASAGPRWGTDDLNIGIGGRIGYTLRQNVYIGGIFDYWFGESIEQVTPGGTVTGSASAWDIMAEAGYDFGLTPTFVLRPFGGLGLIHADAEICTESPVDPDVTCIEASGNEAIGSFGAQALAALDALTLGGELRIIFHEDAAVVFGGNIGFVF